MSYDYDVLVIGSGFGGSVTALRLTEKGYRVGVLESGRRFTDEQFAITSWRLRDYLYAPALGCYGILRLTLLKDVMIMSGAGVGGGSLGYACTLYEPPDAFFTDPQWAGVTDWKNELAPYYDQAKRMLGVTANPVETASDRALKAVADDLGVGHTFRPTPVGVLFGGRPGEAVPDPFFGGAGPDRRTCTLCGSCMTGCRGNAKNTLVKNYLYLAERAGADVVALTTVTAVRPLPGGGYAVDTRRTGRLTGGRRFTAEQVVLAGGALGTQRLLHRMRDRGLLPHVSPRLGELSRTNSESILGARTRRRDLDFSHGVAITSSIHPDPVTHVEPVRYGPGSNLLALLATVLVDEGRPRWWEAVKKLARAGRDLRLYVSPRNWSKETVVLLAMQPLDNSITVHTRRGMFGRRLSSRPGIGEPNPVWVPAAHDVARRVADKVDGVPAGSYTELIGRPVTGHFIGGCAIGESAERGVVDPYHRLFGHPGLHVIDGSVVAANLGVNPSLTITALAERAVALWPNAGEPDPRPTTGYRPVDPVTPRNPVVPATAPAALRLTVRGRRP
ncbi:GMC oxidoreductase [Actinoplanes utahensis]|uniref:Cholesterol oxidase n=1 Tax=Actinoplanes utahensis TaxID=1869 RepID=A0A0A6X973_ACTUT|nr:GMC family oxidoreductase [Actinoplanes utahensis]KHD76672.1 cholesterol oxidase [Actinoplanes utahensis]GIF33274.1 cholesterol oxidase [Actinoplanes utahensis]